MNRKILFRAKCFGNWRYGSYVHFDKKPINNCCNSNYKDFIVTNGEYGEHYFPTTDPSSVGQYTGLKDKNGNAIYEGDILSQGQDLLGVACISMRYGISVKKKTTTWSLINFVLDSDFDTSVLSDVEVVGNIYDNPELLKGGSNEA